METVGCGLWNVDYGEEFRGRENGKNSIKVENPGTVSLVILLNNPVSV